MISIAKLEKLMPCPDRGASAFLRLFIRPARPGFKHKHLT